MLAQSLLRLGSATFASGTIRQRATSLRSEWKQSLKEAIYNLVTWFWEQHELAIDQIMAEFHDLFYRRSRLSEVCLVRFDRFSEALLRTTYS